MTAKKPKKVVWDEVPSEELGKPFDVPITITMPPLSVELKGVKYASACVVCGNAVMPGEVCPVDGHREGT